MAPISASPAAPQSTRRIAHILPDSLEGSKQTAIYAAAIATLALLFLFAGTYLFLIRRRRSCHVGIVADAESCTTKAAQKDAEDRVSVNGSDVYKTAARGGFEASKPPVRSVTDTRSSSLSEMEAERIRFLTFKFPPVQDRVESDSTVAPGITSASKPPAVSMTNTRSSSLSEVEAERIRFLTFKFPPVEDRDEGHSPVAHSTAGASETQKMRGDSIAVQSAEAVTTAAFEARPVKATRTRHDVDRGERTLKLLDAIITQEPTFVVPEVPESLPPVAVDPMRHVRGMGLPDDILAQEPPPLSPVSDSSEADSRDSPDPNTPVNATKDQDVNVLPPIGLAQLPQLPADEPPTVVLVEASPRLTQRYFVHPVLNTWSKLTGADAPLVSHPAIVVEDTGLGELPMQSPADFSLFDLKTSPTMDYLTPSWNVTILDDDEEDEDEEPIYVPPRIVRTVPVRPFSPFVKPRRSQLGQVSPRPVIGRSIGLRNALGIIPEPAFGEQDAAADLTIPAIIAARPSHKSTVQYDYF